MEEIMNLTLEAARQYLGHGWMPVPVPPRAKGPIAQGWQNLRLSDADLSKYFAAGENIGLILGDASGGLVDVDLDASEAILAAPAFLPSTGLVHGHQSKAASHWWYRASPTPKMEKFLALDGTCIVELRSTGGQTIVPPSIHPSGEPIVWEKSGTPGAIDGEELRKSVAFLATSALLGKAWPKQHGSRQQLALAIAGFLLRNGLTEDVVARLIGIAAQLAQDDEYQKRANCAGHTAKAIAAGKAVTGGPNAAELLSDGDKVIARVSSWLGLRPLLQQDPWEPPEPFTEHTGPDFPVDALPNSIRPFVRAKSIALQVPLDLVASLVLGVAAAAAVGRCVVRLSTEWSEPLNLFVVVALPSGERKSPAFRAITAPLEEREQSLVESHRPEAEISKARRDVLEARLRDAKAKAAKATSHDDDSPELEEVVSLANELAEHQVPKTPRLLADDATSESVASMLAENGGRIAIMSTEGGLFETLAGRYADGVANIDVFLKGYSGDPLRVDRKSRPSEFVRKPALTLCLTVQPSVIQDLFSRPLFRGRGLLARFVYSFPKSLVGYRSNTAPTVTDELNQAWRRTIMEILKLPDPPEGEEQTITFGNEARAIFQDFRDRAERRLRLEEDLHGIADWGNKFPGTVARIAGILHLLEHAGQANPWEIPLSRVTIESAIAVGNYYADHALIAYGMMGASMNTGLARRLWAIIKHEGLTRFSVRDMHQKKRKSFPLDDLLTAAALLASMGYLRLVPDNSPPGKAGRRSSPVFDVNPLAGTQNTHNTQNGGAEGYSGDYEDSVYSISSGFSAIDSEEVGEV